jgi:23S rRNA pseudouridine1911/1915/1917 synthase
MPATFIAELIVDHTLHGVRIDSFLIKHFRNYTSWRMQRLVSAGQVTVNQAVALPTQRVFRGELVRIRLLEPPDKLIEPDPIGPALGRAAPGESTGVTASSASSPAQRPTPDGAHGFPSEPAGRIAADAAALLPVRYEDPWILVVEKPAGIITHPTGDHQGGTLANVLQWYLDSRTAWRGLFRPGLVHRLDRQTSGLMVVAKEHRAHAELATAFELGRVSKTYLALVEGVVARDADSIALPIGRARSVRPVLMSAQGDALDPRPARTRYRVLERFPEHTLVEARPLTGRNHQIRVHFAQIGHPLVGDEFYDRCGTFKPWLSRADEPLDEHETAASPGLLPPGRHALHAAALEFAHPITGAWWTFRSRLPDDLCALVAQLRTDDVSTPSCV